MSMIMFTLLVGTEPCILIVVLLRNASVGKIIMFGSGRVDVFSSIA